VIDDNYFAVLDVARAEAVIVVRGHDATPATDAACAPTTRRPSPGQTATQALTRC
jgi:hypothetical protein